MEFVNLHKAMGKYGHLVVEEARKNLQKPIKKGRHGRVGKTDNTGTLSRSLRVDLTQDGIAVSMADYGEYINEGRSPGKGVPVKKLLGWVDRKLKPDQDAASITYLINRSIKMFGIAPTHFLDNAFEAVNKMEIPEIQEAIFEDLFALLKQETS